MSARNNLRKMVRQECPTYIMGSKPMKIINVVGARPNFMKIAPLMEAYKTHPEIEPVLVHTGQHYDEKMSDTFFRELGIAEPDVNLGVGSASNTVQTAEIMKVMRRIKSILSAI